MSEFDFNDANAQRESGGLIPEGTVALAVMTVRPGGQGPGGFLTRNKAGDKMMIDAEFTIVSGRHERRKFWKNMVVTPADSEAGQITRSQLRAAIESALTINPGDDSADAMERRRVPGYQFFDGLTVCVKVGIEKGKDGNADKNTLRGFVTPDQPNYIPVGAQQAQAQGGGVSPAVAAAAQARSSSAAKPSWAQ